jgi:hypothetical protein
VSDKEYVAKVGDLHEVGVELHDQVHTVERHPAASEYDDHGDEHTIGALLASHVVFLVLFAGSIAFRQNVPHFRVAIGDDQKWNQILKNQRGQIEKSL